MKVEGAGNGKKATAILLLDTCDLVLGGGERAEMAGLELLAWGREQANLKAMPFVMVTSRGDKENVVQAIQAGVSGYVSKPFTNEQLLNKVKQALHKIGRLDALVASAPTKMNSAFGNDSLSALTGGKPEAVKAAPVAAVAPSRGLPNRPPVQAGPAARGPAGGGGPGAARRTRG
ncbi:response regulator, partial [Acinetobacter baumannii]|uniref:response regulator n=1 Tax=Acinetobacter baumannii TaxID=470 RepID=UPI00350E8F58